MDLDYSKENVQPLRGGRDVSQLEVALQAQHNQESQQELLEQKQQFELAIRNYNGPDPLCNYYNYICWVEQCLPKQGYHRNLIMLLEDCIRKFEGDQRYINDSRFCKIWIKYIDLQQNPVELCQMLYAKNICRGCTDLYKVWAFYYEADGDFKAADMVFQTGRRELAQPFEELCVAHDNMIYAAGHRIINGIDERRLVEQRQALTMLQPSPHGRVASVRSVIANSPGIIPQATAAADSSTRTNFNVPVYQQRTQDESYVLNNDVVPTPNSVLDIVRRDAPNENMKKVGTWTSGVHKRGHQPIHHTAKFPVLEDGCEEMEPPHIRGIQLPPNHPKQCLEDFSNWKCQLALPEPHDPTKISMYCKAEVYREPFIEFSIEEVRARPYLRRTENRLHVPSMETEQAIQSITSDGTNNFSGAAAEASCFQMQQQQQQYSLKHHSFHDRNSMITDQIHHNVEQQPILMYPPNHESPHNSQRIEMQNVSQHKLCGSMMMHQNAVPPDRRTSPYVNQSFARSSDPVDSPMRALWASGSQDESQNEAPLVIQKLNAPNFVLFEEPSALYSQEPRTHPKGSAMKTPFKDLNDEDLAETGSRGGLDIAAAAQPSDGAKRLPLSDDEDATNINTEIFGYGINDMHVSTPQNKSPARTKIITSARSTKKQLFPTLSMIQEQPSVPSSNTGGISENTEAENNYHFNLAQNSKANAALRSSLLGDYMDCDSQRNTPTSEFVPTRDVDKPEYMTEVDDEVEIKEYVPYGALPNAPSDPFRITVITKLLEHIRFPGRHSDTYVELSSAPRICIKKEPYFLNHQPYVVEKLIGKGTYGFVYKAMMNNGEAAALKVQKPANQWEYYICKELQIRLDDTIRDKFMDVLVGYFYDNTNTSILVSAYSPYGSLLNVANTLKKKLGKVMKQSLCIFFSLEIMQIIKAMHDVKIIHADIKPDNFLVIIENNTVNLQLIDFGCSIDMSLYPEGTMFTRRVTTEDFICCEMLDGRPWSYHTDLFCIAATVHVLLFDKYIKVKKTNDMWSITQKFQRYYNTELWNSFFGALLNMQGGVPELENLIQYFTSFVRADALKEDLRELINILMGR